MKVLIGTKNPGKIEGAKRAFENYFDNVEVVGIKVASNVSEQPVGTETYQGAKNRVDNLVKYAKENGVEADYFVSVESGINKDLGFWAITNIAVVQNAAGEVGVGASESFPVPNKYVDTIINESLAPVMDKLFQESDLRSSAGGISLLTHDVLSRIDLTTHAFVMALTPFINKNLWKDEPSTTKNTEICK